METGTKRITTNRLEGCALKNSRNYEEEEDPEAASPEVS